ncbi:MAG: septum formation protein Maf [Burkholderiales bacterium]|nr:septum formation protein Maf [Burkholderiales bacterium]
MLPGRLILASTSRYRAELLARLRLPFDVQAPDVDESPLPGEPPEARATRLALCKAQAVARGHTNALVIGSDQVAHCDGVTLDKPGDHRAAVAQLRHMRGRVTCFDTALAVVNTATQAVRQTRVRTEVTLRDLSDAEIESYLRIEQPYDCAGSAKSEGLGIALMSRLAGDDPTALIGLPLIALCGFLRAEGVPLFAQR